MALLFYTLEKEQKSILVTNTQIHCSTKHHSDIESFEKSLEKKGLLETLETYEISDLVKTYHSADEISVSNSLANKKYLHLFFQNKEDRDTYIDFIVKIKNFKKSEEAQKPLGAAIGQLLGLGASILITSLIYYYAFSAENGEEMEVTGRRSWIKGLIKLIGEKLGSVGVAGIGGVIILYFAYKTYKVMKNPPNNIVYS